MPALGRTPPLPRKRRRGRRGSCRARARNSRSSAGRLRRRNLTALPPLTLGEQGPQACELGLGFVSPPPFGFSPLALRLGLGGNQAAVRAEEPDPVVLLPFDFAVPEADEGSELLAPEPSVLVGLDRLVEAARQAQPFELAGLVLVQEVFRRAEDTGIEVPLLGAVLLRGGGGEHLEDDVRQASSLFPGDPGLALAARVDAAHPEDVRAAEGPLLQSLRLLFRDLPRLLHGVVDEDVRAGKKSVRPCSAMAWRIRCRRRGNSRVCQSVSKGSPSS